MSVGHYENFPVASILLPRTIRRAVVDIYRFARSADDLADEGRMTADERLAALGAYRAALHALGAQHPDAATRDADLEPVFAPLARTIKKHQLPLTPFLDLISAFEQDVRVSRYADYPALADYCRRSANPVGRLMLQLFGVADSTAFAQSDAICTALQLINMLQDVGSDVRRGRIYLPQTERDAFGVTEEMIVRGEVNDSWRALAAYQARRCRALLDAGAQLPGKLARRERLEIRLIIEAGRAVLDRIESAGFDVFGERLILRARDLPGILWRGVGAGFL